MAHFPFKLPMPNDPLPDAPDGAEAAAPAPSFVLSSTSVIGPSLLR
jgi:hypothetical protein